MSSSMARSVGPLSRRTDGLLGKGGFRTAEEQPTAHAEVEPDGGGLVDDDDAEAVCVVEYLFGVGVVRGPERVGPHPSEECEVLHHGGVVVTPAAYVEVLVLAESPEVERLVVDQELRALHADGANADGQHVAVHQSSPSTRSTWSWYRYPRPGRHSSGCSHSQRAVVVPRRGRRRSRWRRGGPPGLPTSPVLRRRRRSGRGRTQPQCP